MQNYKLTLAYDGGRYHGWQRQASGGGVTIQAKVEEALGRITGSAVEIAGSGRTDAGVHAQGQVASFALAQSIPCQELLQQLRRQLPADIGALALTYAPPRFHARLSAVGKVYQYRIWNSATPCVFARQYVYVYPGALSLPAMEQGAARLLGRHDFRGFSAYRGSKSTVRRLEALSICRTGQELRLTFRGEGFLYNMVRILTGTLLEIGRGERKLDTIDEILRTGARGQAGYTVPAKGLCLMEVIYP